MLLSLITSLLQDGRPLCFMRMNLSTLLGFHRLLSPKNSPDRPRPTSAYPKGISVAFSWCSVFYRGCVSGHQTLVSLGHVEIRSSPQPSVENLYSPWIKSTATVNHSIYPDVISTPRTAHRYSQRNAPSATGLRGVP